MSAISESKKKKKIDQECLTIQKSEAATSKSHLNCSLHTGRWKKWGNLKELGRYRKFKNRVWEISSVAFSLITGMYKGKKNPRDLKVLKNSDGMNNGMTTLMDTNFQ